MESIDLELGELFDRDAVDEDEGGDVGANPDVGDGDGGGSGQEGDEVLSNLQKLAKGAAKKRVMKPQPKLDAQRLNSERGLSCLPSLVRGMKFAGVGHESEDLRLLMSKLEHWAHRLFPKITFADFVERLEKLGVKKEIQTCVKRIRLDMPLNEENAAEDNGPHEMDAELEAIMHDERHQMEGFVFSDSDDEDEIGDRNSQLITTSLPDTVSTTPSSQTAPAASQSLSSDQQRRIEQNRLLAMQKRAARLSLPLSSAVSSIASGLPVSFHETPNSEKVSEDATANDSSARSIVAFVDVSVASEVDIMQTAEELLNDLNDDV